MKTETLIVVSIQDGFDLLSNQAQDILHDSCDIRSNGTMNYVLVDKYTYLEYIQEAILAVKRQIVDKYQDALIKELDTYLECIELIPNDHWINVQE